MWCCRGTVCTIPYVDQYNRNDNFRFRAQPKYILGHLSNRLPDTAPFLVGVNISKTGNYTI
ncbi:hypothetical protein DT042_19480 [Shigella boydii]|nr:hypothetical protein [Shigella boydii]